ncbi:hypothetical protein T10_2205 [Trichinella papuae]|uniref:Uncharacterized protein n=1 Tax=Trichinella papuae TaxID=268474 RepID=A0A0V1MZY0_9BILA|nr:hypothetical protein T10_2205 [Trichinella papuae]
MFAPERGQCSFNVTTALVGHDEIIVQRTSSATKHPMGTLQAFTSTFYSFTLSTWTGELFN